MECREFEENLSAWIDGELESSETVLLLSHMESCAACRGRAEEWKRVWQGLGEAGAPEPGADFTQSVLQKIHIQPESSAPFKLTVADLRFWLVGLMVMVIGFWLGWTYMGVSLRPQQRQLMREFVIQTGVSVPDVSENERQPARETVEGSVILPVVRPVSPVIESLPVPAAPAVITPVPLPLPAAGLNLMAAAPADEEIIAELDMYVDMDLVQNMDLYSEMETIEVMEDTSS